MQAIHFEKYNIPGYNNHDIGYYYTKYNPKTGEGEGWFGDKKERCYYFHKKIRIDRYGFAVMMGQVSKEISGNWTGWVKQ